MLEKNNAAPVASREANCQNALPHEVGKSISGYPVLKFPMPGRNLRSLRFTDIGVAIDVVLKLAADEDRTVISELDVRDLLGNRRYRANPVKALRQVARLYPSNARMTLRAGLWCLVPAVSL